MSRHALLVAYGGGHIRMLVPVARALRRRGWTTTVLALTTAGPHCDAVDEPCVGYRHFVESSDASALAIGRELGERMHAAGSGIPFDETVAYLGLSYADLAQRIGSAQAAETFARLGRHAFLPLGPMRRILTRLEPDVVITTNSPRTERAATIVAREFGVRSLSLVDLFGVAELCRLEADVVCVLCDLARRNLISAGTISEQSAIRITGNPMFDELHAERTKAASTVARKESIMRTNGPIVLWIDQSGWNLLSAGRIHIKSREETAEELDAVLSAARANGASLAVRPHPSQNLTEFREWVISKRAADVVLVSDWPLYPLIKSVDAVVTRTSTVGLEAALLGKPVVAIDPEPGLTDLPVADVGLALRARSMGDLGSTLKTILHDSERVLAELEDALIAMKVDGRAAERVGDEVDSLVHEARTR